MWKVTKIFSHYFAQKWPNFDDLEIQKKKMNNILDRHSACWSHESWTYPCLGNWSMFYEVILVMGQGPSPGPAWSPGFLESPRPDIERRAQARTWPGPVVKSPGAQRALGLWLSYKKLALRPKPVFLGPDPSPSHTPLLSLFHCCIYYESCF